MRRTAVLAVLGLALLATAGRALAFRAELQRYYRAIEQICRTGVTPEVTKLYEDARRAVDEAKYGGGRDGNFFGVKTPEQARDECFQAPGKT